MQQELFSNKRTQKRKEYSSKNEEEKFNITINTICESLVDIIGENKPFDISLNPEDIIGEIDSIDNFRERYKGLNPFGLVIGYVVLKSNHSISKDKINHIFTFYENEEGDVITFKFKSKKKSSKPRKTKKDIKYFEITIKNSSKIQRLKKEDVIRYARFWSNLLSKQETIEQVREDIIENNLRKDDECLHKDVITENGMNICQDCGLTTQSMDFE